MRISILILPQSLTDQFKKKSIQWRIDKRTFSLDVPTDVFASHELDAGTALLVKALGHAQRSWPRALDVGCGYGPIALWLLGMDKSTQVDGIERDWLAAEYARRNAAKANLNAFHIVGGLAYPAAPKHHYDLIVTNLPAKVGTHVHHLILLGAYEYLREQGEVWLVVVTPLQTEIEEILEAAAAEIFYRASNSKHSIIAYRFTRPTSSYADAYCRGQYRFAKFGVSYVIDAMLNVDEFDSYAFGTDLILECFADYRRTNAITSLAVLNPAQGHLAIVPAMSTPSIDQITLLSRDALELQAGQRNLRKVGYGQAIESCHGIELPNQPTDLILASIHEKEGMDLVLGRIDQMRSIDSRPSLILSCKAAFYGLLAKRLQKLGTKVGKAHKKGGYAASLIPGR